MKYVILVSAHPPRKFCLSNNFFYLVKIYTYLLKSETWDSLPVLPFLSSPMCSPSVYALNLSTALISTDIILAQATSISYLSYCNSFLTVYSVFPHAPVLRL